MSELKTEYEGFTIVYLERTNEWKVLDDGTHGEKVKPTLADAKKWVDNTFIERKKKNAFKRQVAMVRHFSDFPHKVTVTSYDGSQREQTTILGYIRQWKP
jgi:hypothetical protein